MKTSVIIPIFHGERYLANLLQAIDRQDLDDLEVLVVETAPGEICRKIAENYGARWKAVDANEFDHAGTRTMAAKEALGEVLVFLSQDVLPTAPETLRILVNGLLESPDHGAAYGRQVAPEASQPFGEIKRSFIYREAPRVRTPADRKRIGFHAAFLSNAFAAYRRDALETIGWFGERALMCEDVGAGARLLLADRAIAYIPEAVVQHDHPVSIGTEAHRYFDIGASHQHQREIQKRFGPPKPEGLRFFAFGARHLIHRRKIHLLPVFSARCLVKLIAYRLGKVNNLLPNALNARLSGFPAWWSRVPHP